MRSEAFSSQPFPLDADPDGVIRVHGARVSLDTVWAAFQEGATAEEIVQQYPSFSLADAYQTIGYCLRNRAFVARYLAKRSPRIGVRRVAVRQRIVSSREAISGSSPRARGHTEVAG